MPFRQKGIILTENAYSRDRAAERKDTSYIIVGSILVQDLMFLKELTLYY